MWATAATPSTNGAADVAHNRALRFLMAGSVDDGKSTLTGRLLYESKAILGDQMHTLEKKAAGAAIDLSLLTDGLEAEREQGITIDVAYRYFSTPKRKFIIADAPGHEQYTRNMVTAAAGSDAAVVLVDITKLDFSAHPVKLLPQTRRHTLLANLLGVPSIVFAVNKIDAIPDPQSAFESVKEELLRFTRAARINVAGIIPISALNGANVTSTGETEWYSGPHLLELLESLPAGQDATAGDLLIPIQYVSRDPITLADGQTHANSARVLWGRIARGSVKPGDPVQIFPSNETAKVVEVRRAGEIVDRAYGGQSAGVVLDRHVDVARGCWLSAPHSLESTERFSASLAWMDTEPAQLGRKYLLRHGSRWVQGRIVGIESSVDIHTLEPVSAHALALNDIGQVIVETQEPLPLEPYTHNHAAGSVIVVDPSTHRTSGVLLVSKALFDSSIVDGRKNVRVRVDFAVECRAENGETFASRARNVSIGGLLMTCETELPVGEAIQVTFEGITVSARSVSHRPAKSGGYNYHLAFYGIGMHEHEALTAMVESGTPV
ncbi:MAG TPA: GTP-binding protein [Candidatus Baltobacteraceae bacterium]|jgi:sulfate adenylyltransferase subunit 1|nr:GTP-binding protein [Candidatus Baltobacteraceae bacterium]